MRRLNLSGLEPRLFGFRAGGLWFLLPSDSSRRLGVFDGNGRVLIAQLVSEGQIDLSSTDAT